MGTHGFWGMLAPTVSTNSIRSKKQTMSLEITALGNEFVGEVSGVDLRAPLSADDVRAIDAGMDRYAVLIFHDQHISDEEQLAFSKNFGPLQPAVGNNLTKLKDRRLGVDFSDVSNLDREGRILPRDDRARLFSLGNRLWHSDASFRAIPAKYSILSARSVAQSGGNTEFADMRAAYDALDEETKQELDGLIAEHSIMYSRSLLGFGEYSPEERNSFAPVRHVLVRENAATGRKSLYISSHAGGIVGWPAPEARSFLFDLMEHATQRAFVHAHEWRVGDLVIWDNRQAMHRVRPFDDTNEVRDMRRTTIMGEAETAAQEAAA